MLELVECVLHSKASSCIDLASILSNTTSQVLLPHSSDEETASESMNLAKFTQRQSQELNRSNSDSQVCTILVSAQILLPNYQRISRLLLTFDYTQTD